LRVARVVVPGLVAGLATTGVVAVATGSTAGLGSAPSVGVVAPPAGASDTPGPFVREPGTSRDAGARAALASAKRSKAAADADKAKAAQAKAAQAKAAQAKAAQAKPAKAKAARVEAERAKAARVEAERARAAKAKAEQARADPARAAKAKVQAAAPALKVVGSRYTRVDLNVRAAADAESRLLTVLTSGSKVSVTVTVRGEWRYVSYRDRGGWVKNEYLVTAKPKPAGGARTVGGISGAACPGGSAVESGLTRDAIRVHRAICARFPSVTSYGGVRADSLPEHPSGRALDAMISNQATGWQIANFVRANAGRLGVSEVLFAQRIWTVQRSSEGWRNFANRGSASANHYDHVHVSVYGNSGG